MNPSHELTDLSNLHLEERRREALAGLAPEQPVLRGALLWLRRCPNSERIAAAPLASEEEPRLPAARL
jgi:hypothetical protein